MNGLRVTVWRCGTEDEDSVRWMEVMAAEIAHESDGEGSWEDEKREFRP